MLLLSFFYFNYVQHKHLVHVEASWIMNSPITNENEKSLNPELVHFPPNVRLLLGNYKNETKYPETPNRKNSQI